MLYSDMISFGATPDILVEFNSYEALFWIVIGGICLLLVRRIPAFFHCWLIFTSINFIIFGFTDMVEIYTGGFLHTATWLLYWKVVHVVGLVISVFWYLILRLKESS